MLTSFQKVMAASEQDFRATTINVHTAASLHTGVGGQRSGIWLSLALIEL